MRGKVFRDGERIAHSTQWRNLRHRDIGRIKRGHAIGVCCLSNRLIRSNRNIRLAAHLGELLHRCTRLFDVAQHPASSLRQRLGRLDCLIYSPPTIRIHAQLRVGAVGVDGGDASQIVDKRFPFLCHLDFEGTHPREALKRTFDLRRGNGGHRAIDSHGTIPQVKSLIALVGGLQPGAQPRRGFFVAVLHEGRELAPPRRAVDEQGLPRGDPPERHRHRQRNHVGAVQNVCQLQNLAPPRRALWVYSSGTRSGQRHPTSMAQ